MKNSNWPQKKKKTKKKRSKLSAQPTICSFQQTIDQKLTTVSIENYLIKNLYKKKFIFFLIGN